MFEFLNKLSHSHQNTKPEQNTTQEQHEPQPVDSSSASEYDNNPSQPQGELISIVLPKKAFKPKDSGQNNFKRTSSIVAKMHQRSKFQLDTSIIAVFNNLLKNSQDGVSSYIQNNLRGLKQKKQKNVYIRQMSRDEEEYFQQISQATKLQNDFLNQQIAATLNGVLTSITHDIEDEKFKIHFKRKRPENNQQKKMQALKLIKMQQSELKEKIGQLNVQLKEQNFIDRRVKQITDKSQYEPQHIKTKLAQEFVKQLQRQKQEKKAKLEQYKQKKRQMEMKIKAQQQMQAQKAKQQRHLRLMQQFAEKQKAKKQRQEESRIQQLNYQKFLKQFKQQKPLFVKKQEEFKQKQKQEQLHRFQILKKQQAKYQPIDAEALQIHEEKYLELKKQDKQRKQAEMELARQELKLRQKQINDKAYKGRFRYIILQQMLDAQNKQKQKQTEKQAILQKKHTYSLQVKQRFKPQIDPKKRQQILQLINSHKRRKRNFLTPNRVAYSQRYSTIGSRAYSEAQSEPDPKVQGKRYHRLFKQYIREKIDRGQIRQNDDKNIESIPHRPPDYLKELRQKHNDKLPSQVQRLTKQIQSCKQVDNYRMLLVRATQFQEKAKMRQKKILNVPHKPQQEARLQEQYLCAIKAKMSLINNID